jgi:hypothetical protein
VAVSKGFRDAYDVTLELMQAASAPETLIVIAEESSEGSVGQVFFAVKGTTLSEIGTTDAVITDDVGNAGSAFPALELRRSDSGIDAFFTQDVSIPRADGTYRTVEAGTICLKLSSSGAREGKPVPGDVCGVE